MNRFARRARAAVTLTALALGALVSTAPIASASVTGTGSKVPFHDEYQHGWLTFCNKNNQPVTSGKLATQPFAWKTISSAEPPAGYRSKSARVSLFAFQPIQYIDPGDWSGLNITGASAFTNPDHPVVQATILDSPLLGFTRAYPAHWDHLVEIRMMYSAVEQPQLPTPYAAAVIRVTATTWTLVEGGGSSCSAGKGISNETLLRLTGKGKGKGATSGKQTVVPASQSPGASSASGHSSGGSNAGSAARLAAADASTGLSGGALAGIGLGALALVWVAIMVIARRRRRASTSES